MTNVYRLLLVLLLMVVVNESVAAPSATIAASPSTCVLSEEDVSCEINIAYSATDVADGWVVEVLSSGFDFLVAIASPGATVQGDLDVLVMQPGKTFGVVLNQGMVDGELLASVFIPIEGESVPGDIDGDGVPNEDDAFPNDPTEFQDSDGD